MSIQSVGVGNHINDNSSKANSNISKIDSNNTAIGDKSQVVGSREYQKVEAVSRNSEQFAASTDGVDNGSDASGSATDSELAKNYHKNLQPQYKTSSDGH